MIAAVYLLCAITSFACAALLFRGYGRSHTRMLLWSALCFVGLFLDNVGLFVDRIVRTTEVAGPMGQQIPALVGVLLLLYGLIWESD